MHGATRRITRRIALPLPSACPKSVDSFHAIELNPACAHTTVRFSRRIGEGRIAKNGHALGDGGFRILLRHAVVSHRRPRSGTPKDRLQLGGRFEYRLVYGGGRGHVPKIWLGRRADFHPKLDHERLHRGLGRYSSSEQL